MGTGMRGWNGVSNQTRLGMDGFEKLFRHIHDQGVIYVDLADMYGSHRYLRHAMKGIPRDKLTILTKTVSREADGVRKDLERFRKEIGTDYIDIVLLHCLVKPDWDTRYRGPMDVLSEAKDKGWIRAHGCSCHKLAALKRAAANPWVDVDLARINPFGVKMDGKPEQVVPVLKQLHDRGAGVLGMKIIGEGAFQDAERREKSLHFITHLPHVDAFCIGFEKPTEVDDIVKRWKTVVG
jgi:predicted aldo/keto reductase-like oxidoreductase